MAGWGGVVKITKYHHDKHGLHSKLGIVCIVDLVVLCPKLWLCALNPSTSSPDIGYVSEPPQLPPNPEALGFMDGLMEGRNTGPSLTGDTILSHRGTILSHSCSCYISPPHPFRSFLISPFISPPIMGPILNLPPPIIAYPLSRVQYYTVEDGNKELSPDTIDWTVDRPILTFLTYSSYNNGTCNCDHLPIWR